ncbi:hypothetical protein Syncc8109_1373 [Synechococcus sp. WH 8109]|nr:hypothetical protein Syncc8109_1373 [Synechococcus sp. WH 8109]
MQYSDGLLHLEPLIQIGASQEMDVFKARQQSKESADSCRKTGYYH